ncbi:MAG: RNA helicase [Gammaproteobacteria bacterium]|nr:MAG: RNA helicase [Gammaproteobacteria bacterium]
MTEQLFSDVTFDTLDMEPSLRRGVQDAGFANCTQVQAGTLPRALASKDVAGQAQTGTGKTAAFLLAAMNTLLRKSPLPGHTDGQPRAVILAPTRELAIQIHSDAEILGRHTGLRLGLVYGGTGYDSQRESLRAGIDILIGTPGRLIDYFKQRVFNLDGVQVVVLDEADRMFDLGFIKDIRYVLRRMPPHELRQNMLFSATLSQRVLELAYEHMNDPLLVDASPDRRAVEKITQTLYHISKDEKVSLLVGLLQGMDFTRTLIFVNTRRGAEFLEGYLKGNGFNAAQLTGDVPQRKRISLLNAFRAGELPILVATDVAARGLHIPDVSHVVNFDLPQDAEDYIHRIGRTARVGASGDAISFACEEYVYSLADIEEFLGHGIPAQLAPAELLVELKPPVRAPRRSGRHKDGQARRKGRQGGRARAGQ